MRSQRRSQPSYPLSRFWFARAWGPSRLSRNRARCRRHATRSRGHRPSGKALLWETPAARHRPERRSAQITGSVPGAAGRPAATVHVGNGSARRARPTRRTAGPERRRERHWRESTDAGDDDLTNQCEPRQTTSSADTAALRRPDAGSQLPPDDDRRRRQRRTAPHSTHTIRLIPTRTNKLAFGREAEFRKRFFERRRREWRGSYAACQPLAT
jgi:hypothetical protein